MFRKIQEARENEEGFTLIELLVVVIIIGILAAIAIPTFLSQRERAYDSAAQSDVRNMATAQESYFTANDAYTATVTDLTPEGFNPSDGVSQAAAIFDGTDGFCVAASHTSSDATFWWINQGDNAGQVVDTLPTTPVGLSCPPAF